MCILATQMASYKYDYQVLYVERSVEDLNEVSFAQL